MLISNIGKTNFCIFTTWLTHDNCDICKTTQNKRCVSHRVTRVRQSVQFNKTNDKPAKFFQSGFLGLALWETPPGQSLNNPRRYQTLFDFFSLKTKMPLKTTVIGAWPKEVMKRETLNMVKPWFTSKWSISCSILATIQSTPQKLGVYDKKKCTWNFLPEII